ncbi:phage tail sheath family protein [Tateyamaria sp. SN3-11]|uniref:phage tail sheath family protein n=1 Tax=Tateyamaria sp. SN3-11 TaxID=3092147 RepID=UPI0039ECE9B6
MAFIPTFPGVYIREIPSGARTIVGAPTSIAAFVGAFSRGPLDTPIRMFTLGDFDSDFGGVHTDYPTSFAVSQCFLNGAGQCYSVRVSPDASAATVVVQDEAVAPADTLRFTAGRRIAGTSLDDPGEWANALRFDVDHLTTDPLTQFNLTISEIRDENGIEVAVRTEVYRNITIAPGLRNAIDVVNAASGLIQISRDGGWGGGLPAPTGYYSDVVDDTQFPGIAAANTLDIDFGAGTQSVDVPVPVVPTTIAEAANLLQGAIRAAFPADRLWSQATVTVVGTRLRVQPGRGSPDYDPATLVTIADNVGDLAVRLSLDGAVAQSNVMQYAPTNAAPLGFQSIGTAGADGSPPTAAELRGSRATRTGLYALDDIAAFTMLAIPEASRLGSTANLASVMGAAISYCQERRAMVFIDPPLGTDTIEECEAWLDEISDAGLRSEYSVAYVPNVQVPDPGMDNRPRSVAPSGTMAGIWARTDSQVGVWKAPAGITSRLNNVLALDFAMTDPENGVINPLGLNALRNFDIPGNVAWGARTLAGADLLASDWKYIPVRRMANFIESTLFDGLQWAVFMPNDEPLWNEMRSATRSFMQGLFRQGAFQGASPDEAYRVKCDAETTTPADIAAGIVNIFVGFAPLRPAEFVVISLQLQIQQDV